VSDGPADAPPRKAYWLILVAVEDVPDSAGAESVRHLVTVDEDHPWRPYLAGVLPLRTGDRALDLLRALDLEDLPPTKPQGQGNGGLR
jgi:hypothetical protein